MPRLYFMYNIYNFVYILRNKFTNTYIQKVHTKMYVQINIDEYRQKKKQYPEASLIGILLISLSIPCLYNMV